MILTGENDTDWRWTSTWLRQVLEDSGKFDVEVALFPSGFLADECYYVDLDDAGMPEDSWVVEAGCLKILPGDHGGEIQTARTFDEFELEQEWKVPEDAASALAMVSFGVSDGMLVTTGVPLGYLQTAETYGDFTLELDWRFDPRTLIAGEGGLLLGVSGEPAIWPRGLEVHLGSGNAGDLVSWGEYPIQGDRNRTVGNVTRHIRNMERRTGQWNHLELRLEGGELTVRVNG